VTRALTSIGKHLACTRATPPARGCGHQKKAWPFLQRPPAGPPEGVLHNRGDEGGLLPAGRGRHVLPVPMEVLVVVDPARGAVVLLRAGVGRGAGVGFAPSAHSRALGASVR